MKKIYKLIFSLFLLIIFYIWQNNSIHTENFTYSSSNLPADFDNFKITHISDLHNKTFGSGQKNLLRKVSNTSPDIIVVTGDLIDRRRYNLDTALEFMEGAVKIAPVYYVYGNHEAWSGHYDDISKSLKLANVNILENTALTISKGTSSINILGLNDPAFLTNDDTKESNLSDATQMLSDWSTLDGFKILLSHRPELMPLYSQNGIDLVFSGHAHGGQFRFPFVGGLVAPNQGFFPKYTSGKYTDYKTTLFVSRGLGNSIIPIRIFNRPHIISITFENK